MDKVAVMDDATMLGFLTKHQQRVFEDISAVPEFELKGEYNAETLLPVVKTLTTLAQSSTQESIKTAAGDLLAKFDQYDAPAVDDLSPKDALVKSLAGIEASLAKRGARNSAEDLALLQNAHDTLSKLGAQCATNQMDGKAVALPAGSVVKTDTTPKDGDVMSQVQKDAISSEGNKRGASVTSPSMPAESSNATNNAEAPNPSAVGAVKAKAKPAWYDDMDGDDDETKAAKSKAREMFGKSEKIELTKGELVAMINEAVSKAVGSQPTAVVPAAAPEVPVIPRVAPALMSVGKDGDVQKATSVTGQLDELKKGVTRHAADEDGRFRNARPDGKPEDNDTCTVIKAIHAKRVYVPNNELAALGLVAK